MQAAATAAAAGAGRGSDPLVGLDDDEAGAVEGVLEGLAGTAAQHRLHVHARHDVGDQGGRPGDGGLHVDEGGLLRAVEDDRLADGAQRDGADAADGGVEQAAGHHARRPRTRLMSHSIAASKASRLRPLTEMPSPSSVDEVDVAGLLGEEDLALAGDAHQRDVLAGDDLLDQLGHRAGLLVVEADLTLEGHHPALDGEHVGAERDPQHVAVLEGEPLSVVDLEVVLRRTVRSSCGRTLAISRASAGVSTSVSSPASTTASRENAHGR